MNRDRLLRVHLRERFVVTLKNETTFDGLLDRWDKGHMVFVNARALSPDGSALTVDGDLWLPRGEVAFMQRPYGGAG